MTSQHSHLFRRDINLGGLGEEEVSEGGLVTSQHSHLFRRDVNLGGLGEEETSEGGACDITAFTPV